MAKAKTPAKAEKKAKTLAQLHQERLPILEDRNANRKKSNFDVEFEEACNAKLRKLNEAIQNFGKDVLA